MFILLLVLCHSPQIHAQTFEWAHQIGGSGWEYGPSIVVDTAGNIYINGSFEGTVDFDPGEGQFHLSSIENRDAFLAKSDPDGNFISAMVLREEDAWYGEAVVDNNGNIYLFGYYYGTVAFAFGSGVQELTAESDSGYFILQMDTDFNLNWAVSLENIRQPSIDIDSQGNIICHGFFTDTTDFDPGTSVHQLIPQAANAYFLLKLDSDGSFVWVKNIGSIPYLNSAYNDCVFDDENNMYFTGRISTTFDFDPGPGVFNLSPETMGVSNIFILKLDVNGLFIWAKLIGGPGFASTTSLNIDGSNNIYVSGYFSGTIDFDPGPDSYEMVSGMEFSNAGLVCKLNENGEFQWARKMETNMNYYAFFTNVTVDAHGSVYVCGHFANQVDITPLESPLTLSTDGNYDMIILKLNPIGNLIWAKQLGGPFSEYNGWRDNMTLDNQGKLLISGLFQGTVDFDLGPETYELTSNGDYDIFLLKMDGDYIGPQDFFTTTCDSYVWPVNGVTYTNSGTYTAETLEGGETTLHTLHLTLIEAYVQTTFTCNSVTWSENGMTYTESGYYEVVYTNAAGCDSIIALNLTLGYLYTTHDTVTACESYTWPVNGLTYTESTQESFYLPINGPDHCDSLFTLALTILPFPEASSSLTDNTITANTSEGTYQWLDCNAGFSPIPGATGQSFTPESNGSYAVELSSSGCADTSACITVGTLGILENSFSRHIKVYPNPTEGILKIELDYASSSLLVSVRNAQGKLISTRRFENSKIVEVDVEGSSGIYLLELRSSENERALIRVMKE